MFSFVDSQKCWSHTHYSFRGAFASCIYADLALQLCINLEFSYLMENENSPNYFILSNFSPHCRSSKSHKCKILTEKHCLEVYDNVNMHITAHPSD